MNKHKNIAIAGVGIVGSEVIKYIQENLQYITDNCMGVVPTIKAIASRTNHNIKDIQWYNDPQKFFDDPEINLIVELIGGADGVAYQLVQSALAKGIDVVTANKALIAKHGNSLNDLAKKNNAALHFEASVAGSIPIIKTLNETLATNHISEISGILNGTCNFILSLMYDENMDFDQALQLAQEKGYAEADPTLDIDGIDAAHKISIISSIAFKTHIDFNTVKITGIREIQTSSFEIAKTLKYKIKLIARTFVLNNKIYQYVLPFFIPNSHPLSNINLSLNSLYIKSDLSDTTVLTGPGAGGKPTSSAIISDIGDILRKHKRFKTNISNNYQYEKNFDFTQNYILHFTNNDILTELKNLFVSKNITIISEKELNKHHIIIIATNNYNFIANLKNDYKIEGSFGIL